MLNDQSKTQLVPIQIISAPATEEEISLWELWDRLRQGKWAIIAITFFFLIIAIIYLMLTTTVYESDALVELAEVAGTPLGNAQDLATRLYNAKRPANVLLAKKLLPRLHSVSVDKGNTNALYLVAYGKSPTAAQSFLQESLNSFIQEQQNAYNVAVGLQKQQLKELQSRYHKLTSGVDNNNLSEKSAVDSKTSLQIENLRLSTAAALLQQIFSVQNALLPAHTHPAEILQKPTYNPIAVSPKKGIILVLAVVFGVLAGIFYVLIREAFRARRRSQEVHEG